jgi:hypothetical protein
MSRTPRVAVIEAPETNVALFAFLLHFPWEFLQVPFFAGMTTAPHWEAVTFCTRATLGDVAITLVAFWGAAVAARSRDWIRRPQRTPMTVFVVIGVLITVLFERLATGPLGRWSYSELMPVVPGLGVGLVPIVQWLVLPPALVWLVRRQLAGARGGHSNAGPYGQSGGKF